MTIIWLANISYWQRVGPNLPDPPPHRVSDYRWQCLKLGLIMYRTQYGRDLIGRRVHKRTQVSSCNRGLPDLPLRLISDWLEMTMHNCRPVFSQITGLLMYRTQCGADLLGGQVHKQHVVSNRNCGLLKPPPHLVSDWLQMTMSN